MKKYLYINIVVGAIIAAFGITLVSFCIAMSLQVILLIIGAALAVIGLLLAIPPFIKVITMSNVLRRGRAAMGEYVTAATTMKLMGVAVYYIEVMFKDENGEILSGKTAPRFSFFDTQCYEKMKQFKVLVYKKNVEIIQPIEVTGGEISTGGEGGTGKYDCDDAISKFKDIS